MAIHPIVFLYRHALELYLKTIIDLGNNSLQLSGRQPESLTGHDISALLPAVKKTLDSLDCSDIWTAPMFRSFSDLERVVRAVNEMPFDAFRYPIDRAGQNELLPDSLCFNAMTFADKLDAMLDLLHSAAIRAYDTFQAEAKALSAFPP